jgi:hypothetical protein
VLLRNGETWAVQLALPDVLSAHGTGHGHSREARREALARVHECSTCGHCYQGDVAPGLSVSGGIVCAGVLDGPSTVSNNFKPQGSSFNRFDEIDVDHL